MSRAISSSAEMRSNACATPSMRPANSSKSFGFMCCSLAVSVMAELCQRKSLLRHFKNGICLDAPAGGLFQ